MSASITQHNETARWTIAVRLVVYAAAVLGPLPFGSRASKNQNGRSVMGNHHSRYQASQKEGTMTAPLAETTSALSKVQGSKTVKWSQEGIIAGTCGAATITLWFLLLDMWAGPVSYTHLTLPTNREV